MNYVIIIEQTLPYKTAPESRDSPEEFIANYEQCPNHGQVFDAAIKGSPDLLSHLFCGYIFSNASAQPAFRVFS